MRERTVALLSNEDPETLWYDYGIIPDFTVCRHRLMLFDPRSLNPVAVYVEVPARGYTRTPHF